MSERESKLQKSVMNLVRQHGGYIYKNAQNMYTEKGRPDLCACIPVKISKLEELFGRDTKIGIFVGLEMKREGHLNEVSTAQEIAGKQIQKAGGIWAAVDDKYFVEILLNKLEGTDAIP